jgi:hypothetical protein
VATTRVLTLSTCAEALWIQCTPAEPAVCIVDAARKRLHEAGVSSAPWRLPLRPPFFPRAWTLKSDRERTLFKEDDPEDALYIVSSGTVQIMRENVVYEDVHAGGIRARWRSSMRACRDTPRQSPHVCGIDQG